MNYIRELNAFFDWLETNPLEPSSQTLWFHLMAIANKSGCPEWFTVINPLLQAKVGVTENTLSKHRNILQQRGRIEYRSQGKQKAGKYRLILFTAESTSNNEVNHEVNREVNYAVNREVKGEALLDLNDLQRSEKETDRDWLHRLFNHLQIQGGIFGLQTVYSYIGVVDVDMIELALMVGRGKAINYFKKTIDNWVAEGKKTASDVMAIPEPGSAPPAVNAAPSGNPGSWRRGTQGGRGHESQGKLRSGKPNIGVVAEGKAEPMSKEKYEKALALARELDGH